MCLILFACHMHPDYPLILIANRDEFHARPTRVAQWWYDSPNLLAGQDLTAGGTWLGITTSGRIAAITNYRDPSSNNPVAHSRGALTTEFLQQQISPEKYQEQLQTQRNDYNGYNLLFGSVDNLYYFSNRGGPPFTISPGIHGLSNHLLDTPWPKVSKGKQALEQMLKQQKINPDCLWTVLADPTIAADEELPETGIGLDWERQLSAIRIVGDHYGTRTSTLLLVRKDGQVHFVERTLLLDAQSTEASFSFPLQLES